MNKTYLAYNIKYDTDGIQEVLPKELKFKIPKEDIEKIFSPEELQNKYEKGWPLTCHMCRDNKIDTSEIDYDTFIKIQQLEDLND